MEYTNFYRGKKVLVTGSTGFKGSWLCLWLKSMGAEVYGYALPPTEPNSSFIRCNLESNTVCQKYADLRCYDFLKEFMIFIEPDIVFHLAAQPLVLTSYEKPVETYETNVMGSVHILEAVRNTPSVRVVVNVTTDKCYKNVEQIWAYRECDPMGGDDPYSASKACSEILTESYIKSYFTREGTANVATARAGNVIGGGDWADKRIVPDFFRAWQARTPLEIRNPNSVRPWQHVLEPLNGYLMLAYKLYNYGKQYSGSWNFGPEQSGMHTVKELVEGFISMSKHKEFTEAANLIAKAYEPKYKTPRIKDKLHEAELLKLDISKSQTYLGWKPVLSFEETIKMTMQGYLDEFLPEVDLRQKRLSQIKKFCDRVEKAKLQ